MNTPSSATCFVTVKVPCAACATLPASGKSSGACSLASEKNRLHKLLTDAGVRLGVVVSDLHGQSARAMVKALIASKGVPEVRFFDLLST